MRYQGKKTQKVDMRVPVPLLERIDAFAEAQAYNTRTAATFDLIRKGLDAYEKERVQLVKVGAGILRVKEDDQ